MVKTIATIQNQHPELPTTITLTTPFVGACPHSGEPQEGSFLSVSYQPKDKLIEIHAIEEYLKQFSEGSEAVDLETVAQRTARDCYQALGVGVTVEARYRLSKGLEVVCRVEVRS